MKIINAKKLITYGIEQLSIILPFPQLFDFSELLHFLQLFLQSLQIRSKRLCADFSPCIQPILYIKILENTITPIDSMTKSQFTQSHIFIDPKQTDTIQAILYKQCHSFDIIPLP